MSTDRRGEEAAAEPDGVALHVVRDDLDVDGLRLQQKCKQNKQTGFSFQFVPTANWSRSIFGRQQIP